MWTFSDEGTCDHNCSMYNNFDKARSWPLGRIAAIVLILGFPVYAQQSPWGNVATKLATEFSGPIARGFSLVAIVLGGITLAFSDGGGKRTLGGLIFGLGMALGAAQFMTWLFG